MDRLPVPRGSWWRGLAAAVALLALLAPVGLAIAAPRLAAVPAARRDDAAPPLPTPAPNARPSLDGLLDPLPLVVSDLPDAGSRLAAEDYRGATLLDPTGSAAMFQHAWHALVAPPAVASALARLGHYLACPDPGEDDHFGGFVGSPAYGAATAAVLPALRTDPRNADRLSNAAVALFALGLTSANGGALPTLPGFGCTPRSGSDLQHAAIGLLNDVDRAFTGPGEAGPGRATLLNLALYTSLELVPKLDQASAFAARQLHADPNDRTARALLGNLQARQVDAADRLDRAVATLTPLLQETAAAPLGRVALGDAYLAAALLRRGPSPFLARNLAQQALAAYDEALLTTTDPGVYAGRAAALAALGFSADAIVAQGRAVALAPRSPDLWTELAMLQEQAGEAGGMQASARAGLDLGLGGWDPPLARVRLVWGLADVLDAAEQGDRGYLGYSYGSDRDHAGVQWETAGGGYVAGADLIPRTNEPDLDDSRRRDLAPRTAADLAVDADVLLGSPDAASADGVRWARRAQTNPRLLPGTVDLRPEQIGAAWVTAGLPFAWNIDATLREDAVGAAELVLRRAGRFAEAAAICRRAAAAPAATIGGQADALRCAGETAYLAGDFPAATVAFGRAVRLDRAGGPPYDDRLSLQAGAAALAAGDAAGAKQLFANVPPDKGADALDVGAAFNALGDLALDADAAAGAATDYDRALTALRSPVPRGALALAGHAHGNRGIALLRRAQTDRADPPDCAGARRGLCLGAQGDFAAALAIDPRNPVFLLNAGWAARLLGDTTAARTFLAVAAAEDPTLFPALNDLGVLASRAGDEAAARHAFRAALAAAPGYDLAAWNLGVLEMRRGLGGLLRGQAYLARAIAVTPSFRTDGLTDKTDERVYRVAFGVDEQIGHSWAFGRAYSLAAVAFGSVTVLAAVSQALSSVVAGQISGKLYATGHPRLRRGGGYLRAWARRRAPLRPLGNRWRTWAPWLLTIPALVTVTTWPAWRQSAGAGAATAALALYATLLAVLAHEVGHRVAARWARARVTATHWGPGLALAVLLLPAQLSSGPYVCQRVWGGLATRRWWVYAAGPIANLGLAVAAYGLFLVQPLPVLRRVAQVQLAAIGYALLPFEPLDGPALQARRPRVVAGLGLATATAGLLLTLGLL